MFEPKPMASLSSGLLARKGDARPAMRRAYLPTTMIAPLSVTLQTDVTHDESHDDLGWNDTGLEASVVALAPAKPVVIEQQERISRSFTAAPKNRVSETARPRTAKAAFTLRIEAERHLRLRLASAVSNRSAQQLVTQALDAFLEQQPGLDALVAQARQFAPDVKI